MAGSGRQIRWNVPAEYHRTQAEVELAEAKRMLARVLVRVGVPAYLLSIVLLVLLRQYLPLDSQQLLMAVLSAGASLIFLFLGAYLVVFLGRYETLRVRLLPHGVLCRRMWLWKSVAGYRFRDVAAFPNLRMLELALPGRKGNERLRELVFDPAEIDERELSAFIAEVLPGKERHH